MKIERHETGPRMSKAVIHGDTVYLAGIVADNPKGKNTAEQTRSILSQIDGFLATAGTNKTKLLSANIWITDMANFAEMNAVWDAWVSREIRQRGRPLRPSLHRWTTRSRSWS
jgi:enamine deaminase RidA (YjgF/YER057c/UK114 family)